MEFGPHVTAASDLAGSVRIFEAVVGCLSATASYLLQPGKRKGTIPIISGTSLIPRNMPIMPRLRRLPRLGLI